MFSQIREKEGERFGHFCRKVLKFLSLTVLFATNRSCEHHDIQRDNRKEKGQRRKCNVTTISISAGHLNN